MKVTLAVLFLCVAVYSTDAVFVSQCVDSVTPVKDLENKVKVGACKKSPCRLRRNTQVKLEMKITPDKDIPTLKNNVFAVIVGVPFPFVGVDGTDACENLFKSDGTTKTSCPLKAGEEYIYKNEIDVLQIYPRIGYRTDDLRCVPMEEIQCLGFDAHKERIRDKKVKTVVHWGLIGPDGYVSCFEVPARITN